MLVCRVAGQAVSTVKCEGLKGFKLLVCEPLNLPHQPDGGGSQPPAGPWRGVPLVAVDLVGAGEGDVVGVVLGEPARHAAGLRAPVDAAVVAILDEVTAGGRVLVRAAGARR